MNKRQRGFDNLSDHPTKKCRSTDIIAPLALRCEAYPYGKEKKALIDKIILHKYGKTPFAVFVSRLIMDLVIPIAPALTVFSALRDKQSNRFILDVDMARKGGRLERKIAISAEDGSLIFQDVCKHFARVVVGEKSFEYESHMKVNAIAKLKLAPGMVIENEAFVDNPIEELALAKDLLIDYHAFAGCTAIAALDIPGGVIIKYGAFQDCTSIKSIKIAPGVKIDESAFARCSDVRNVSISSGAMIEDKAFIKCKNLHRIDIGSKVSIKASAFSLCGKIAEVSIKSGSSVGPYAFFDCAINELTIESGVIIEENAFSECTIASIIYEGNGAYRQYQKHLPVASIAILAKSVLKGALLRNHCVMPSEEQPSIGLDI